MGRSWKDEEARARVLTDPLLRKGHAHPKKQRAEAICPFCKGKGVIQLYPHIEVCPSCEGEGVIQ